MIRRILATLLRLAIAPFAVLGIASLFAGCGLDCLANRLDPPDGRAFQRPRAP